MKEKTKKKSSGMTYRSSSRRNGWSCPPHPLQFVAWIFIAFFAVMYHGMAVPAIPYHWQPACHMIVGITLAGHVITHLVCLTIDPADPNTFRRQKKVMPTFDRNQHSHVIENNHCYLCEVDVGLKSKHCSSCNKCVADFDHHCKWLNNCVGSRNYRWFITCLSTALLSCLFVFVVFLYLSVVYWANPRLLHPNLYDGAATTTQASFLTGQAVTSQPGSSLSTGQYTTPDPLVVYREGLDIFRPVPGIAFFVVSLIITVLLFVTLCLLGHLLGFHFYLMYKGITTYDYVVQDRNTVARKDVEVQQQQAKQKGCCKCNNQVVPLPKDKEDMELTETKKDTVSQLESNNNSNGNLQQQLVVAEPLIKQEQEQQQKQQVEMDAAVADSKPKVKRKKKAKRKPPRVLTTRERRQPAALMEHPYPALMNPAHTMPQTYLEQHLVRRFSLPLVAASGVHAKYPTAEPVEDLFFTQQFPGMQQHPGMLPNQGGMTPRWQQQQQQQQQLPPPAAISFDSPTPALDYHSSSAESLTEVPLDQPLASRLSARGMMPARNQHLIGGLYEQPLDRWQPNHNSHPNLMMNGNQWLPSAEQWPIDRLVNVSAKTAPHPQKARQKGPEKNTEPSTGSKGDERVWPQRMDLNQEPLLRKTAHLPEDQKLPIVHQTDQNAGKTSKRRIKKQPSAVETTADVHQALDHQDKSPQSTSHENAEKPSTIDTKGVLEPHTEQGLTSHSQQKAPPVQPVPLPRRRAPKLPRDPSSHSGSQSSIQSTSSHQHLLPAEDRSSKANGGKMEKADVVDEARQDAVSLRESIPKVPPLDLAPLVDTMRSEGGSTTDRDPVEVEAVQSENENDEDDEKDDDLVQGFSSPVKTVDPLRPVASRRSLLLRY